VIMGAGRRRRTGSTPGCGTAGDQSWQTAQMARGCPSAATRRKLTLFSYAHSKDVARQIGVLAGKSGHDDIVDVAVVEGAIRRSDAIVTSNITHIQKVARSAPQPRDGARQDTRPGGASPGGVPVLSRAG
jgi:hypothetical protein